jgi:DNA-binding transcriptional LysR family regulator
MAATLFELIQLRYFAAVADELNFRRAARRLNMTQPPLSRHIKLLEHAVGVNLFDRSNHSVRLTAAGERFFYDAIDILQRAESATLFARQAQRGESGTVVLGFVPSAAVALVPRIVSHLRHELPGVSVTPREMMSFEQVEGLNAGSLDIAIMRLPRKQEQFAMSRIWSEPFMLALPRGHPLAGLKEIRVQDLNSQKMIGYSTERGGFLHEIITGFFSPAGVAPEIVYSVSQSHTVMSLVNSGLGLGLVPRSHALICMENTVMRDIALPDTLRSDLYMALGPRRGNPLVSRVAAEIEADLGIR